MGLQTAKIESESPMSRTALTIILGTLISFGAHGCISTSGYHEGEPFVITDTYSASTPLDPAWFLGADYMQSPSHDVLSVEAVNGRALRYSLKAAGDPIVVLGTEQTKARVREINATETLRKRSTLGAMLLAAKDRTVNLIETPYRIGKSIVGRAEDVHNVEDAVLFLPKIVGDVGADLFGGIGELAVTAVRISTSAAGTECSGLSCASKAGNDILSGANSLAGKHNVARTLHAEFGTDPETSNKSYRRQIDRISYASAYTSTTIKLGAGQAGIDYISPAFTGVGIYNNGEFIGQYEDAHRQRNKEKENLLKWGADIQSVERFYKNKTFTKLYRRRLFTAFNAIQDKEFVAQRLTHASEIQSRYKAEVLLVMTDYIAALSQEDGAIIRFEDLETPHVLFTDGTLIQPLFADYLYWTPELEAELQALAGRSDRIALHVLGQANSDVIENAINLGVKVLQLPDVKL